MMTTGIYRRSWIRYLKNSDGNGKTFRRRRRETIYYVYVTDDENHLTGILTSLERLHRKTRRKLVKEIMIDRVVTVHVNDVRKKK